MDEIKLYILRMDEMSGGSMVEIKLYILRMDEMSGGSMDEIKLLAGIFQNILQNGKVKIYLSS